MNNKQIEELLKERAKYRLLKNYKEADEIKIKLLSISPNANIMDSEEETWFFNLIPRLSIRIKNDL